MATFSLHGIPVSRGIAIGRAHLLRSAALDVKHYLISQEKIEAEVERLSNAIAQVHAELQTIRQDLSPEAPSELGAFIDVHALILSDPIVSEQPLDIIRSRYYNAEWRSEEHTSELKSPWMN
jgi:phosphotransferase system enzyme I (PtsI)